VDSATTEKLLPKISWKALVISESGLKNHESLVKLVQKGVGGFLIGESLLRGDVRENLQKLLCPSK
jgi:indole-3-glycerol phosphate synthase